jgi:hypothetical protein
MNFFAPIYAQSTRDFGLTSPYQSPNHRQTEVVGPRDASFERMSFAEVHNTL